MVLVCEDADAPGVRPVHAVLVPLRFSGGGLATPLFSAFSKAIVVAAVPVVGTVAGLSTVVPTATESWLFGLSLVTKERSVATEAVDAGLTATPSTF